MTKKSPRSESNVSRAGSKSRSKPSTDAAVSQHVEFKTGTRAFDGSAGKRPSIRDTVDWLAENEATVGGRLVNHRVMTGQSAQTTDVPLRPELSDAIHEKGIDQVYDHQAEAIRHARLRKHVTLATPTGSGKSLPYSILAAERALVDDARTLYIAPTRALINNQADDLYDFLQNVDPSLDAGRYTGGLSRHQKRRVRERQPHVLATTPDMINYSILPFAHKLWGWFLSNLDLIVIDEQHQYRGVFGSHVGVVLRRLRRLAKTFDADPTIVACSATIDNPRQHTVQLTGVDPADVHVVDQDTSAGGSTHWLFWQPPRGQQGQARSTHRTTARLAAALVERGLQTIVFTRSRQAAEQYAQVTARRLQRDGYPGLADDVAAYQAALSDERREELEAGLHSGDIRVVWSTNALEVGVNIGNLDAVLVDGYPGTRMELFQQAGRAGRGTDPSIVGLVGGADPLDQYALDHPDDLLDGSVESVECNPQNPRVVTEHLPAAAAEAPLTTDDNTWFGDDLPKYVSALTDAGILDRSLTSTDVTWTYVPNGGPPPSQHVSLRSINSRSLRIVVIPDNQSFPDIPASNDLDVLGELPLASGLRNAHPGAIYFHQGQRYRVIDVDLDPETPPGASDSASPIAWVEPTNATYTTSAVTDRTLTLQDADETRGLPGTADPKVATDGGAASADTALPAVQLTELTVSETVVSYYTHQSGSLNGPVPIETNLPETELSSDGLVITIPPAIRDAFTEERPNADDPDATPPSFEGSLYALTNALLGVLPATVLCDRSDMRGLAISRLDTTGHPTIVLYDDHPGGVGLARSVFQHLEDALEFARTRVADCGCDEGCPACIHHPHDASSNQTLDKVGARLLADLLLDDTHAA
ncbi:DEAD/DEAH box helicase [Halopenitus sp. H-Gu1]|uniref:DEAD/DEAH box helicase n=1 Tax=Halopenitus sp. H-Gu1 TaxID=3242697 RepID=UPI00359EED71